MTISKTIMEEECTQVPLETSSCQSFVSNCGHSTNKDHPENDGTGWLILLATP